MKASTGILNLKLKSILAVSAALFVGASSTSAAAAEAEAKPSGDIGSQIRFKVEKYKLPNGLTVLLHEDHSAPLISYQTWFSVGSKNEEPGLTGIAHLFEHMMFRGAKRYTGEQFDTVLQANGATNNAFTTNDYTGYYENLPAAKLEVVIDIESDRMENLKINAETLAAELGVVKEERRMRVDNSPSGMLREALFGTAFRVSNYRWPVIGYMTDLDHINVENAQAFHKTFYAPNNAIVVVAGDFDSAKAKKLIEKYYAAIPSQTIPDRPRSPEPAQTSNRTQMLSKPVQTQQFVVAFHTPKNGEDDSYALDLLANILGFGDSSRLHQRLVYKDQTATSVSVYNQTLQETGLFQVYVTMKPGVDHSKAYRSIVGEMWRPRNLLVSDSDLQKAKNQVMKSYVDGLKTVHGRAEVLALNETLYGDYEMLFKDLDRYNKVTREEIRAVAKKYLAPEMGTLVVLKPEGAAGKGKSKTSHSKKKGA